MQATDSCGVVDAMVHHDAHVTNVWATKSVSSKQCEQMSRPSSHGSDVSWFPPSSRLRRPSSATGDCPPISESRSGGRWVSWFSRRSSHTREGKHVKNSSGKLFSLLPYKFRIYNYNINRTFGKEIRHQVHLNYRSCEIGVKNFKEQRGGRKKKQQIKIRKIKEKVFSGIVA